MESKMEIFTIGLHKVQGLGCWVSGSGFTGFRAWGFGFWV